MLLLLFYLLILILRLLYVIIIILAYNAPKKMILSDSDSNDNDNDDTFNNDMMSVENMENIVADQSEVQIHASLNLDHNKQIEFRKSNVNWKGDETIDPNPPKLPFKESSDLMNRHAAIYIIKPQTYNYYDNSDSGRRKKVNDTAFDICATSEFEYESPAEDLYYDPRQLSKWKWETDYTSIQASEYDSSSTKSDDELSYKECKFFSN
jgi:hypothetical protein